MGGQRGGKHRRQRHAESSSCAGVGRRGAATEGQGSQGIPGGCSQAPSCLRIFVLLAVRCRNPRRAGQGQVPSEAALLGMCRSIPGRLSRGRSS